MRICIHLGTQALLRGDPPVGAVIVKGGEILGRGIEAGKTMKDITFHAEIEAIRDAIKNTKAKDLQGCTLYSTHEPCLMCAYVIRHYKISCIVCGTTVPFIGGFSSTYPLLTATNIPLWIDPPLIIEGILAEECEQLTLAYQSRNQPD